MASAQTRGQALDPPPCAPAARAQGGHTRCLNLLPGMTPVSCESKRARVKLHKLSTEYSESMAEKLFHHHHLFLPSAVTFHATNPD